MIVTKPEVTDQIVRECAELGITRVWMYNGMHSLGTSVSEDALAFCRQHGMAAIPGGCPMMYCREADLGHRFMRWFQELTGSLPKQI